MMKIIPSTLPPITRLYTLHYQVNYEHGKSAWLCVGVFSSPELAMRVAQHDTRSEAILTWNEESIIPHDGWVAVYPALGGGLNAWLVAEDILDEMAGRFRHTDEVS